MRTLVVAGEYPWPENSGSRIRLLTVLRGLVRCGPTELFAVVPRERTDFDPPDPSLGLQRVAHFGYEDRPVTGLRRLSSLTRLSTPFELQRPDGSEARRALARFMAGRYDLVWYFGARAWSLVGGLEVPPAILDLDDLEDRKIEARLSISRPRARGPVQQMRKRGGRAVSKVEMRRWGQLHRLASQRMAATVVCSQLDADRAVASGLARVSVIPNAYRRVGEPLGGDEVHAPPTVLFQGTLRYPPNAEAARYLVADVAPALQSLVPDVRIRLVGRTSPSLSDLDDPPRVTMVGQVADIADELARADVIIVPIRFGSGTRVKILEAFAHRIPVVSTTLGAEGLDAEDGIHLLLADTPGEMAAACARLLSDPALRASLADRALDLFLARFQSEVVEAQVSTLARHTAGERIAGAN